MSFSLFSRCKVANDYTDFGNIATYCHRQYKTGIVDNEAKILLTTNVGANYRKLLEGALKVMASNEGVTYITALTIWKGEYDGFSKEAWDNIRKNTHGNAYPWETVLKDNIRYIIDWVPSKRNRIALTITAADTCDVLLMVSNNMTKYGVEAFLNTQKVQNIIQESLNKVQGYQEYKFFYDIEIHSEWDVNRYITWINEYDFIATSYFMDSNTPEHLVNKLRREPDNEYHFKPSRALTVRDYWVYGPCRYDKERCWESTVEIGYNSQLQGINDSKWYTKYIKNK